jgi:hypothetical protein
MLCNQDFRNFIKLDNQDFLLSYSAVAIGYLSSDKKSKGWLVESVPSISN